MNKKYTSLAIDVSNKCNLNCIYCFEARAEKKEISSINISALYKGINYFLCNMVPDKIRNVHFHFGRREPLLNFSLLQQVVKYLEKEGVERSFRPYFHLTTNGTIFSNEINEFLKDHNFDIRVSIDGFSEVHDKSRKYKNGTGSFTKVIDTIESLKKKRNYLTINTVYSPNISFDSVYKYFSSIDIKRVDFFPLWLHDCNANNYFNHKDISKMERDIEKLTTYLVDIISDNGTNGITKIVQVEKYLQHLCGYRRSLFYCGAGRNYIGISSNGDFYPCLKFINTSHWKLGNYLKGIEDETLTRFSVKGAPPVSKILLCQDCLIRDSCKGFCYADRIKCDSFSKSVSFYCIFQKAMFRMAELLYNSFKENSPETIVNLAGLSNLFFADDAED